MFIGIRSANSNEDPTLKATYFGTCPGGYLILSGVLIMPMLLMTFMEIIPIIYKKFLKFKSYIRRRHSFHNKSDQVVWNT